MADINVVLGLDDAQYKRSLNQAQQQGKNFASDFNSGLNSINNGFNKLGSGVDAVANKMQGLTNLLIGGGIVAFANQIMNTADQIDDLSKALGITASSLMEMNQAAVASGGGMDDVAKMMSKMSENASSAAEGNYKLRATFAEVGLSMQDMARMSPEEVFQRVATELANITNVGDRTRIAVDLLGKSARFIDWQAMSANIAATSGTMTQYGANIQKMAQFNDQVKIGVQNLQIAFANLLGPIVDILSPTDNMAAGMERANVVAGALAVGLVALAAGPTARGMISIAESVSSLAKWLGIVGTSSKVAAEGVGLFAAVSSMSTAQQTIMAGVYARVATATMAVNVAQAQLTGLQATGTATAAELAAAETALAAANGRLAIMTQSAAATQAQLSAAQVVGTGAAGGLSGATTILGVSLSRLLPIAAAAAAALALVYSPDANAAELDDFDKKLRSSLSQLNPEQLQKYYDVMNSGTAEETKALQQQIVSRYEQQRLNENMGKIGLINAGQIKGISDEYSNQITQLQSQASIQEAMRTRAASRLELEARLSTAGRADREAQLFAFDEETKRLQKIYEIEGKLRELRAKASSSEEQQKGIGQVISAYEQELQRLYDINDELETAKRLQLEQNDVLEMRKHYYDLEKKARDQLLDIEFEMGDLTRASGNSRLAQLDKAIAKEKLIAIEKRKAQLGMGQDVSAEEAAQIAAEVESKFAGVRDKTQALIEQSRSFSTGWAKAFNEYADNATNAAKQAERLFNKTVTGMEDLIVNFAKTGKFEWKDFLKVMAEELLRSQIQVLFANLFGTMTGTMRNAGTQGTSLLGGALGLLGGGGGGGGGGIGGLLGGGGGGYVGGQQTSGGGLLGGLFNSIGTGISNLFGGLGANANLPYLTEQAPANWWEATQAPNFYEPWKDMGNTLYQPEAAPANWWQATQSDNFYEPWKNTGAGSATSSLTNSTSWFDDLSSSLGRGWDTVTSWADDFSSSIGDFFGGWFAEGGTLGAGRWGIAGEAGPEIIRGPATIEPLTGMGGGQNVTYNINAVDARSFQQLVAKDPAFIHAIVMQGARQASTGRR